MEANPAFDGAASRPPPGAGYDEAERAYAEWVHRFVARLSRHLPTAAVAQLMPIGTYWALHARGLGPEDAADAAYRLNARAASAAAAPARRDRPA